MTQFQPNEAKERQVLTFIATYSREYGYPPAFKEVMRQFQLPSQSNALYWIRKLERAGLLTYRHYQARTLTLTPKGLSLLEQQSSYP